MNFHTLIDRVRCSLLVGLPIFIQYKIGGFDVGLIVTVLIFILGLPYYSKPDLSFTFFLLILVSLRFVNALKFGDVVFSQSQIMICFVSLISIRGLSDYYFKYNLYLFYTLAIVLLLQIFLHFFFLSHPVFLIPYLDLDYNGTSVDEYYSVYSMVSRPSALFLEPSYLGKFILYFSVFYFYYKREVSYFYIFLIFIGLLSQSILFYLGVSIIIFVFILSKFNIYKLFLGFVFTCLFLLFGLETISERLSDFLDYSATNSFFIRAIRGWYVIYYYFDSGDLFFGLGSPNHLREFLYSKGLDVLFLKDDISFNGFQSTIIYGGLLSLFFLIFYLKKVSNSSHILLFVFIFCSLVSSSFMNVDFIFMIIFNKYFEEI